MAGSNRASTQAVGLLRALGSNPQRFEFYAAMRALDALDPKLPRIGRATRPAHESVRLGQEPSLAFAPSMLADFRPAGEGEHRLDVLFFGMFGPNGPLPLHLTEYARDRERQEHDPTFRRFADVFHHRMLSLFYRAWADAQPAISLDRPDDDRYFAYLGALIGLGAPAAWDRDDLPDHTRVYLAGLMAMQNRPAEGLRAAVEEYLDVPVSLDEFVGEWLTLPEENHLRLGVSESSGRLGLTTTAGARTWYCQGRIRVVCGPLALEEFMRLLPSASTLARLNALVRSYAGDELAWELNLVLEADQVPGTRLGEAGELGWTTWLGRRRDDTDANDVVIRLDARPQPAAHSRAA